MKISYYQKGNKVYVSISHQQDRIRKPAFDGSITNVKVKHLIKGEERAIQDFLFDQRRIGVEPTFMDVVKYYQSLKGILGEAKDFFEYYDQWIKDSRSRLSDVTNKVISPSTIKRYSCTKNALTKFQTKTGYLVTIKGMKDSFYEKFRAYVLETNKQSVNTFSDHIKQVKAFCKWLQKKEPTLLNDFREWKKPFSYADAEPFKPEELLKLYDSKSVGGKEKARLILLMLCSTGLRISDYNKLDEDKNFYADHIKVITQKTNTACYIPFFDSLYFRPVQILEEMKSNYGCIPKMTGQKLNEHIANLCKDEDFKITRIKPTSKTGRKTFATLNLLAGVNPEIIMKSTGHKKRESFDAYVGIDTSDILREYRDKIKFMKAV